MIPRRRIRLDPADWLDWLRAPLASGARAEQLVAQFEQAFAAAMQVPHAHAVASGRDALCLIVDGLGLQAGDELVIPAYTLGELLPLLSGRGLALVPADIDPASYNVTADSVRAVLTPRTRAILAVHLLGAPCDIAGLCALGPPVIEDCAHAPGATVNGRPVGSFGIAALYSLEANKALSAYGGGVLSTRDAALSAWVVGRLATRPRREWPAMKKMLLKWLEELLVRSPLYGLAARVLFSERLAGRFERFYRSGSGRLRPSGAFSALQARLALRRLRQLDERERRLRPLWQQLAAALPPGFSAQRDSDCGLPACYNFVARHSGDLRALRRRALRLGLDLGIHGEVMDDTAALLGRPGCPGAATAYREAVLIPLYDGMSARRLQRVIARLQQCGAAA